MSTTTENFNIVLPEGSDTFNPLTFNNNAFTRIDEVMKDNQDRGVTTATHTYIDGINTILRAVATCNTLVFVASSDYEAGSSIAVDGVTCTFRYADGTAPKSGAFKTNQAVLCYLNGTILTLMSAKGAPNASDVAYDTNSNVNEALNTLFNRSNSERVIGKTADGALIYERSFVVNANIYVKSGNRNRLYILIPIEGELIEGFGTFTPLIPAYSQRHYSMNSALMNDAGAIEMLSNIIDYGSNIGLEIDSNDSWYSAYLSNGATFNVTLRYTK